MFLNNMGHEKALTFASESLNVKNLRQIQYEREREHA
jgi:hypothetical protein